MVANVMRPFAGRALLAAALVACSAGSDDVTNPPAPANFEGTYSGNLTLSSSQGTFYAATLQLVQTGRALTGTLTVPSLRNATVTGTIDGSSAAMTFIYTDTCAGTAVVAADLIQNGAVLTGTYTNQDCTSALTGGFSLTRQ